MFCTLPGFSQDKSIGVNAGLVDTGGIEGGMGFNMEFYYEKEFLKNLNYGINFGIANHNNFPEGFEPVNNYVNGVPALIDEEIRNLAFVESFNYRFQKYNVEYSQLYLKYSPNLNILGFKVHTLLGLMLINVESTAFGLAQWKIVNDRVDSYTPRYSFSSSTEMGAVFGVGINRQIVPDLHFSLNGKYNGQFNYSNIEYEFLTLNMGLSKRF